MKMLSVNLTNIIRRTRSNKGTTMVMFALGLALIMGGASIAVDIGVVMYEKAKLSAATDAAALAGAQQLHNGSEKAIRTAREYLEKNGIDPSLADISISDDQTSLSVTANKDVGYFFARVLGFDTGTVKASAVAKTAPVSAVSGGVRPFAVEEQELEYGNVYTLKEGAGGGHGGNYHALALGGNGASNYRRNIINGYGGKVKVGDLIDTEPGNMKGPTVYGINTLISRCNHSPKCTFDNYRRDCPRVITVLIVDSLEVNGRKKVMVTGFASFFLEGVSGSRGHAQVTGRFIENTVSGEIDESQADYGLRGVKLSR